MARYLMKMLKNLRVSSRQNRNFYVNVGVLIEIYGVSTIVRRDVGGLAELCWSSLSLIIQRW
jgi:hypothetical protein